MKILEKIDNKLLGRTEIKFEINQEKSPVPSRLKVQEELANQIKKSKDLIVIKGIKPDFGTSNIRGIAFVYNSKETMEKIEPKYIIKRLTIREENKEEAPQPEEKAEKPAEAPKDQKSEEKKETKPEEPKEDSKNEGKAA